jgi:hypothetical protein
MLNPEDQKLVNEVMNSDLPEAPKSTHIDAYYRGFHVGFTVRDEDNSFIPAGKVKEAIDNLVSLGFQASWNQETNNNAMNIAGKKEPEPAQQIRTKGCPICGGVMIFKSGIKNNRKWAGWFCADNKTHVEWIDLKI